MHDSIKAAAAALVALQRDTAGALAPIDADASTRKRVKVAFEAMAPNTRRSYANALAAWGRWAAAHGVSGLSPAPVCRRSKFLSLPSARFRRSPARCPPREIRL